jgi:hypothetical protein
MRGVVITGLAVAVLTGCSAGPDQPANEPSTKQTVRLDKWTMSPDSFGPITVSTTRKEALATGAYRVAPGPCSAVRLDWRTQTYKREKTDEDQNGKLDEQPTPPFLPDIEFDYKKPSVQFIDPGPKTMTDRGIRKGDTVEELKAAYSNKLISAEWEGNVVPGSATFAVNGKRSYLLFDTSDGRIEGFFIVPGTIKDPKKDFLVGRGGMC